MSGENQGPDLFFAGGECLDRFGVWVRRTDMDLEAATKETHARNSDATAIGRDGILRTWQLDTPRAQWLNAGDLSRAYNLIDPSEELEKNPPWNDVRANITRNVATAPDGEFTADLLTEDNSPADNHRIDGDTIDLLKPTTAYVASVFARTKGRQFIKIEILGLDNSGRGAFFDLENGIVSSVDGSATGASISAIGGGWFRCEMEATSSAGSNQTRIRIFMVETDGSTTYDGDGVSAVELWGAQVEEGTLPAIGYQATPQDEDRKSAALFLEDAATNRALQSETLENAVWLKFGATVAQNTQVAPDGQSTADVLIESALNENHGMQQDINGLTDGFGVVFSLFVKPSGREWVRIVTVNKAGAVESSWFNTSSGVFGTVNHAVPTVERLPNNWYRISAKFNASVGGSQPQIEVQMTLSDATGAYLGNGSSGMVFWGLSAVEGSAINSYIPTGSVLESRALDIFSTGFPPPPQPMTFYCKFIEGGPGVLGPEAGVFFIGGPNSSSDPRLLCFSGGVGGYQLQYDDGVANVATAITSTTEIGDLVELICQLEQDGRISLFFFVNGSSIENRTVVGNPLPPLWSEPTIYINSEVGIQVGFQNYLAIKAQRGVRDLRFMQAL